MLTEEAIKGQLPVKKKRPVIPAICYLKSFFLFQLVKHAVDFIQFIFDFIAG